MRNQPRYKDHGESAFFDDASAARRPVEGTVARGLLKEDEHLYTGKIEGKHAATYPFEITAQILARGRERFDIHCAVCHDATGYGLGMVVRRGFKQPPSLHEPRLRELPPGYFFDVITNGFGAMYSYAGQVKAHDRWAIAAYIQTLQLSQNTPVSMLAPEEVRELENPVAETHAQPQNAGH